MEQIQASRDYLIMPSKHAMCSPSAFNRWANCPASAKQNQIFRGESSYAAVEGTVCHEIAEMGLKELVQGVSLEDYWLGRDVEVDNINVKVTQTLIDTAKVHIEYCRERERELEGRLLIEEQVEMNEISDAVWGTSDTLILSKKEFNTIEIVDFKAGKWPVKVDNNPQLKIYGLGALSRYGNENTKIIMTIVQPRTPGKKPKINSAETTAEALVDWGYSTLKDAVDRCLEDDPVYKAGDWCRFCAYKEHCDEFKNTFTKE